MTDTAIPIIAPLESDPPDDDAGVVDVGPKAEECQHRFTDTSIRVSLLTRLLRFSRSRRRCLYSARRGYGLSIVVCPQADWITV